MIDLPLNLELKLQLEACFWRMCTYIIICLMTSINISGATCME